MEAYEKLLETWMELLTTKKDNIPMEIIKSHAVHVFNSYVQCHISPPDGCRVQVHSFISDLFYYFPTEVICFIYNVNCNKCDFPYFISIFKAFSHVFSFPIVCLRNSPMILSKTLSIPHLQKFLIGVKCYLFGKRHMILNL
jgi:hypothetical protein